MADDGARVGRPRDGSVDVKVLRATFEILAEKGFRGLRMNEVARRAGVPKSTIYRRWPSSADLAVDAVDAALGPRRFPVGEDPLADLSAMLVRAHSFVAELPLAATLPHLALELAGNPNAAESYRERVIAPLRDGAVAAVERAVAAGIWDGPEPDLSVDMMVGTATYRLNYLGHVPTLEEVFEIAEAVAGRPLPRPEGERNITDE